MADVLLPVDGPNKHCVHCANCTAVRASNKAISHGNASCLIAAAPCACVQACTQNITSDCAAEAVLVRLWWRAYLPQPGVHAKEHHTIMSAHLLLCLGCSARFTVTMIVYVVIHLHWLLQCLRGSRHFECAVRSVRSGSRLVVYVEQLQTLSRLVEASPGESQVGAAQLQAWPQ